MLGAIIIPIIYSTVFYYKLLVLDFDVKKVAGDNPVIKLIYFLFIANFLILGILGGKPVEEPYYTLSQLCTVFYFYY